MPSATVSLPVLPTDRPMRLTPTDVTQFVRFEQCERFLRFRLAERAGQKFMTEYDVNPQRITPLLSLSGHDFEEGIEKSLSKRFTAINYAEKSAAHDRPSNNTEVVEEARKLAPGKSVVLFQPRLDVEFHGWLLRGDVDLVKLDRSADGALHALIGDMKSTIEVKVEHRLQVAFYRLMLEQILKDGDVAHAPIQTGILLRPSVDPTPEEEEENKPLKDAAKEVFGLDETLLEIVADGDAYVQSAHDLVLAKESTARRVAGASFEAIPYCLSFKCDGCLYNEFCMKWSAEQEDLSLLPYMTGTEKEALRRAGITTVQALATLKDFVGKNELVPAPGREAQVKQIASTWPVGPRLDELIHRAKSFRRSVRKDGTQVLSYIPGKGNSSLPVATHEINPNLIRIYLDAQHDYLEGRVYLLGALVVSCKDGTPVARRSVVRLTDGPPDTVAKERQLFVEWTKDLLKAVVEIAVSDALPGEKKSAPLHIIFFDRYEQRLMLEGLARNFPPIIHETPPLYDFLTQIAAFDSPIASFLDEEMRTFKNFPMTCQSLQSVAQYLKFDWTTPHNFRELFKARIFDHIGKLEIDGTSEWFTRRSRFASSVPLEYAYSAWGELPTPRPGKGDEFAPFREMTMELVTAFEQRRLEALEHVTNSINGNPFTEKTPFVLPDLAHYEDKAHDLAHALHEFVTIERLVTLDDWKATRHAPPERRVLMGEALLVRYCEADQLPGIAEQNRENERRRQKREEYAAAFRAANPDKNFRLKGEQAAECKGDDMAAAVLLPEYPLVVVVHDEAESQMRNLFEQNLIEPVLRALADPKMHGLNALDGMGIVVPHRAQRAALQLSFPELCIIDAATGMPVRSAIDTVERFQGGERTVIMVSATESDRAYLLASSQFLLDPRRLTVALSRAKRKMILVASRSIFSLFSPDEETFANSMLWKNLLRTCPTLLWEGERAGKQVAVWGGKG